MSFFSRVATEEETKEEEAEGLTHFGNLGGIKIKVLYSL
jgi:hypothetical protein